jgi:tetratricopeptide (TPR) repeat protein
VVIHRVPVAAIAVIALACRGPTSAARSGLGPLVPAHDPAEARSRAETITDHELAAQVAYTMANDRAYARARLAQARPTAGSLLLSALLSIAELDRPSAIRDLSGLVEAHPVSPEAEVAMMILYDWASDAGPQLPAVLAALERSGLLGDGPAPPGHRTLATALAIRIAYSDRDVGAAARVRAAGGWLSELEIEGPLGPVNDVHFIDDPPKAASVKFRGMKPPTRTVAPKWRRIPVTLGDVAGVYRVRGCFEIGGLERVPVVVEAHLSGTGRLSIDGTIVVDRPGDELGPSLRRRLVRLAPGWHCAELLVHAHHDTRPAISILSAEGRPVIVRQAPSASPLRERLEVADPVENGDALRWSLALSEDPERSLYARVVGCVIALSRWVDDVDLARALLDDTDIAAPRSAAVHALRARLMAAARLPESAVQTSLERALAADPSHPSVLLALIRSVSKDDPERGAELIERLGRAAPRAPEASELAFRLAKQRGWNAEAASSLERAVAAEPSLGLLIDGAQFYRGLDRIHEAEALEAKALARSNRLSIRASIHAQRGDLGEAIEAHLLAHETSDDGADDLVRAGELELGRGNVEAASKHLERASERDPLDARALRALLNAHVAAGDGARARSVLERLQALGDSSLRAELSVASLDDTGDLGIPKDPWLRKALAFDVTPFVAFVPGTETPRGLDPADRWATHKAVTVLDRIVDHVRPNGGALSLRHSVVRIQTKEASDSAGEISLGADAIPLALRTLKPDGRAFDVDRHAGKEDLSFSGLAPGDAVERKWLELEDPATPWGGYVRRFYFESTSPIVRSDFMVIVPKGARVVTRSYNGAPLPTTHEMKDGTAYYFSRSDVPPLVPEPYAAPAEEHVPFAVIAVDVDEEIALRSNGLAMARARISHDIAKKGAELIAGSDRTEEKVERIFSWVAGEIGLGGENDADVVLTTRRGERTALLAALLRSIGLDARVALVRPGTAAQLDHDYPSPSHFGTRFVRVEWDGGVRWARVDTETPWLGGLPPAMRGGRYLLEGRPRPAAVRDDEVEQWRLESIVELEVDENGTAKGRVRMTLPGTFGAELRDFARQARRDDLMRHLQGWIGSVIDGARLLGVETRGDSPLVPLVVDAEILIGHFMVREGDVLVSEQFFDTPLAHVSLGLPTLASYLRVPSRTTPMLITEVEETMTVIVRVPGAAADPAETPKSFQRAADWGSIEQGFEWDAGRHTAKLVARHALRTGRLAPSAFAAFRESAQEIVQSSRNRLVIRAR